MRRQCELPSGAGKTTAFFRQNKKIKQSKTFNCKVYESVRTFVSLRPYHCFYVWLSKAILFVLNLSDNFSWK